MASTSPGSYEVRVRGRKWLQGAPTYLHYNQRDYSAEDGSLRLMTNQSRTGEDILGTWTSAELQYSADGARFITVEKVYDELPIVIFEQVIHQPESHCEKIE